MLKVYNTLFYLIFVMKTLLTILLVLSWAIFVWSVLLMSPKGGLGSALGGVWAWSEYGSKKSLEWKLKKIALITSKVFVVISLILPYVK